MKKLIFSIFILFTFILLFYIYNTDMFIDEQKINENTNLDDEPLEIVVEEFPSFTDSNILHMEKYTKDEVIKRFGEPSKKISSLYSEEVFVYTDSQSIHLQIGFIDDNINSFIVFGDGFEFDHMALGMSSNEMKNNVDLENEITYEDDKNYFKLLLSEKDLEYNPLIKLSDTLFLQLYFDVENDEVVAMRFMDGLTLVKHRMYKMEYSGDVPTIIDDDNDEWDDIENDMENTILELTNIIRNVHGKSTLELNDSASKVAKNHSEDMYRHNYFSHTSLNGHSLADRLEKANTKYIMAAENIAKSHTDSVAAVLGWLNSKGHRDSLLDDEYNEIGVGVYRQYYTQVFLAN